MFKATRTTFSECPSMRIGPLFSTSHAVRNNTSSVFSPGIWIVGFRPWFYRLFFVFSGLVVVHVLATTLWVVAPSPVGTEPSTRVWQLWLLATLSIFVGGVVTWFVVRRMMRPLAELSRHVRLLSGNAVEPSAALDVRDELGALAG